MQNEGFKNIKLVASDCDGVLTDGGLYYSEEGFELKRFHVLDGMGFLLLKERGIKTAIITAENNPLIKKRADKLKVDFLIMGTKDKLGAIIEICQKITVNLGEVAYIGDDCFDVPAIEAVGFGCVPNSAFDDIKEKADYVTKRNGGQGCFREIANIILETVNYK